MFILWLLLTLLPVLGGAERFNCKTRILGAYYADAKSGCKAFHVCVRVAGGGVRDFRFFCPPGTLFHQEAQTCTDGGDDDPLACPADIYDGQFDLYKIGSGFDTKKLSPAENREDETEYGLQRAETGDRRLAKNNIASNAPVSDLRAAHSSDFFTGQRDRGRDEPIQSVQQTPSAPQAPAPFAHQSSAAPSNPIIVQAPQTYSRQSFRRPTTYRTTTTQYTTTPPSPQSSSNQPSYETSKRKLTRKRPIQVQNKIPPTTFAPYISTQQNYTQNLQEQFNRRVSFQSKQTTLNLPPQFKEYKDEYVEVSRVTPKTNIFYPKNPTSPSLSQHSATYKSNKKEGIVELYNYESLSTPGLNTKKDNRSFDFKNNYNIVAVPKEPSFEKSKNGNFNNKEITKTIVSYSTIRDSHTTPAYKGFNSVSYKQDTPNAISYSKNAYVQNPTTSTTTTTPRPAPPANLNTVAYNTNIGFNVQSNNFAESGEDDGQYRPPQGEDDGLYRPELYEKELLSGAHSINIAASGNRLLEHNKSLSKPQKPFKVVTQSAAQTTREPEIYTTTQVPKYTINTQRTFDYYKTYTTTSRPTDFTAQSFANDVPSKPTTSAPRNESRRTRPQNRSTTSAPATVGPSKSSSRPQYVAKPTSNKEDTSYDYAYYDTDPGFSEYGHNLEFGKTKTRA